MDDTKRRTLAAARALTTLAWFVALAILGAWLLCSGGSLYNDGTALAYHLGQWSPLILVAIVAVTYKLGRERATRRFALAIGVIGGATMLVAHHADGLALGLVERIYFPSEGRFCSFTPAVAPAFSYISVGWVAVALRGQAELFMLVSQRETQGATYLARRVLGLAVGLLLTLAVAELALFLGACNYRAIPVALPRWQPDLSALLPMLTPILALLIYELWLQRERRVTPTLVAQQAPGPRPLQIRDPLALRRARISEWVARGIAAAILLASVLPLRRALHQTLLERPEHFGWLLAGGLASALALALLTARRPYGAVSATPVADDALPPQLRALVEQLEQLRGRLEHERLAMLTLPALKLVNALEHLDEPELELLAQRSAAPAPLARALRGLNPLVNPTLRTSTRRRAAYAELTRFGLRVRGSIGVDPYRSSDPAPDPRELEWLTCRPPHPVLGGWLIGAFVTLAAWVAAAMAVELGGYGPALGGAESWIALALAAFAGPFAYVLARTDVCVARARACPPPAAKSGEARRDDSPKFAAALVRRRARAAAAQVASGLAALALGLTLPLLSVRPGPMIGAWSLAKPGANLAELGLITPVLGLGLLVAVLLVPRLNERVAVARRRRWQRRAPSSPRAAALAELIALRLVWAEGGEADTELLAPLAAALRSVPELGALAAEDRDRLVERLEHARDFPTARSWAREPVLPTELATAEELLCADPPRRA